MRFFSGIIPFLAALLISVPVVVFGQESRQFAIGYATDMTGKGAFLGRQGVAGARLAVAELQAQSINVRLVVGDHQLDAKHAVSEVGKMLESDDVDALMVDFTPTAIAVSPIAEKAKRLLLYIAPAVSIAQANPYAFKSFLDYEQGCAQLAKLFVAEKRLPLGMIKLNTEFGELCLHGAASVTSEIEEFSYDTGNDLKVALLRFREKGVKSFLQTAYEIDMLARLRGMSDLRYFVPVGVPQPLMTKLVLEKGGAALAETVVFGFSTIPEDFQKKLLRVDSGNDLVNVEMAALTYLHVQQIVRALAACPKRDIRCQVQQLAASPPNELLEFKGWQERIGEFQYSLRRWHSGKWNDLTIQ